MSSGKRPDRTTMEGMIWNANHVLDQALSPDTPGVSLLLLSYLSAFSCYHRYHLTHISLIYYNSHFK